MEITNTLYVTSREEWRAWLEQHYQNEKEIWLIYYRKESGKPRIPYNDAVEEALCFGWIDSTAKALDAQRFAQKFSPRRPKSPYSQPNKERLQRMIAQGKVLPEVREKLGDIESFEWPEDIMQALQSNPAAWENFQRYSPSYQRIRVAFVDSARDRPGEFEKRLQNLIRKSEQNKQFGFGIEAYF